MDGGLIVFSSMVAGYVGETRTMAVNDIYVVKQFQNMFNVAILNVYFYRQLSVVAAEGSAGLFEGFDDGLLSQWVGTVHDQMSTLNVEVFAIATPEDFTSGVPTNSVGTRAIENVDRQPPWSAFSFKSNRSGAGSRSSFKRYAGLQDEDISGLVLTDSFLQNQSVIGLGDELGDEQVSGAGSTYIPIQVKSGWVVGVAPIENFTLTNWQAPTATTQVSRKV